MSRATTVLGLAGAAVLSAAMVACSSGSGGGSGGSCDTGGADGGACVQGQTPAYVSCVSDLSTPTISYSKEIQPLFERSCGIAGSTCHGDPSAPAPGLFLGLHDGGTDAAQVLSGIVGKPAPENPQMSLVKAGDPGQSYLMHKLDGDQCQYASACNQVAMQPGNQLFDNCGLQMPNSSPPLDSATRDDIRRWIAQGAKND